MDRVPHGIVIVDDEKSVVYYNSRAKDFFPSLETGGLFQYEIYEISKQDDSVLSNESGLILELKTGIIKQDKRELEIYSLHQRTKNTTISDHPKATYEKLLELNSDFVFELEINRSDAVFMKWASSGFADVTGFKPLEINAFDKNNNLIFQRDIKSFLDVLEQVKDGSDGAIEVRINTKENKILWFGFRLVPVFSEEDNRHTKIIGTGRIIQDRMHKTTTGEQSIPNLLENAIMNLVDPVFLIDRSGLVLFANVNSRNLICVNQDIMQGCLIQDLIKITDIDTAMPIDFEDLLCGKVSRDEIEDKNLIVDVGEGRNFYSSLYISPIVDADGVCHGYTLHFHDIFKRMYLTKERKIRERIESISLLAGGLAHDFNNILMGIIGNVDLAKMMTTERDVADRLGRANDSIRKAKHLTKQLRTIAKGRKPRKKTVNLRELLNNSVKFAVSGTNVKPVFRIAKDLYNVDVDEFLISEAVNEVIRNSIEAMPKGGELRVSAKNTTIDDDDKDREFRTGKYVVVTIKDTGKGIENQELFRVIDPYFSTKAGAMGMGLPIVHSIFVSHDGYVSVDSQQGEGTTVKLYLPASFSDEKLEEKSSVALGKKVLVIDDEALVREVSGGMLKKLGYDVDFAFDMKSSIEKIEKALQGDKPFDAVIVDLIMNGRKTGVNILKRIRGVAPEIKAILSSGYSNDPVISNFHEYGFDAVLLKPYTITELREVLKNSLHSL